MGISLLAPLFLAGLAALAIPVFIHLTQKTKKEAIPFPSLMFLSRVPYKTTRRQQIRHWWLFLLRSAAIVILVIAFARPWLQDATIGDLGLESAREVVVMLDQSYSMGYGDRWERARTAARDVINGLGSEDRGTVVLFSDHTSVVQDHAGDGLALRAAINAANVSSGVTHYELPLQVAEQILLESRLPQREAVLITDFQRVGWEGGDEIRLPQGATLSRIDVTQGEPSNTTVADITLDRSYRGGRERVTVLARIINQGPDSVAGQQISLSIDGDQMASQSVSVGPNGSAVIRFPAFAMPQREVRGSVQMAGDALPADNSFRFVLSPEQSISVLVLEHPSAARDESLYLTRALAIGSEPPHTVNTKRATALQSSDLDGRSVVILNDAPFPRGTAGRQLRDFVNEGGGLWVVLGSRSRTGTWPEEASDLLPGSIGVPVDRLADRGGTLSVTDYDHPVFDAFSAPRSGDFSVARYFRYRRLPDDGRVAVLARFDDGNIALAELSVGEGKVLVWTSDLSNSWNDLPVQPVFLPVVHQVVRHLARYQPQRSWLTAGQVINLSQHVAGGLGGIDVADAEQGSDLIVEAPNGERDLRQLGPGPDYLTLDQQGFYEIRRPEDSDPLRTIAVNLDIAESDLTQLDAEQLASAVLFQGTAGATTNLAASLTPAERERRQGLWWYLLVAVLLIMVAESVLSNRVSSRAS